MKRNARAGMHCTSRSIHHPTKMRNSDLPTAAKQGLAKNEQTAGDLETRTTVGRVALGPRATTDTLATSGWSK
jgi:hypothetical protein